MAEVEARAALAPAAELAAALSFLTRIPVAMAGSLERTGAAAFGIVGQGLGVVAALPVLVLAPVHPVPAAILALAILTVLDGALHLDGLADTADALAAPAGAAEHARTDPRTGTAGVVAILVVLGLQAAAIAELSARSPQAAAAALVIAVTVSRAGAPVWAVVLGRAAAPHEQGLGRWFADRTGPAAAAFAAGTAVIVTALAAGLVRPVLLPAAVAGTAVAAIVGLVIVRLRGQLDGDGYGANVELTLAAILLATTVAA